MNETIAFISEVENGTYTGRIVEIRGAENPMGPPVDEFRICVEEGPYKGYTVKMVLHKSSPEAREFRKAQLQILRVTEEQFDHDRNILLGKKVRFLAVDNKYGTQSYYFKYLVQEPVVQVQTVSPAVVVSPGYAHG